MFHCDSDGLNCWLIASSYKKRLTEIGISSVAVAGRSASGFSSKTGLLRQNRSDYSINHADVFSAFFFFSLFYLVLFLLIFFPLLCCTLLIRKVNFYTFEKNWYRESKKKFSLYQVFASPAPPESPSCTVREDTESGDIKSVTVSCSTSKVYPRARCRFYRQKDVSHVLWLYRVCVVCFVYVSVVRW